MRDSEISTDMVVACPRSPGSGPEGEQATRKLSSRYRRIGRVKLRVTEGPDRGKTVTIDVETTSFVKGGRSAVNDLVLADRSVSGTHFELHLQTNRVILRDLGSCNGVYVGGLRVHAVEIEPDAVFRVGESAIQLAAADAVDVPLSDHDEFEDLYGQSVAMRQLFATLERIARKGDRLRVLIGGETGTGKELVARGLHERSSRRRCPFVVRDCATIPRELAESALFGHAKGAFTGATEARVGCFEEANGGTLFLDEIGELPLELQAKLLRALQEETVTRVGEQTPRKVDVRVISATHRDLRTMVGAAAFREDLFFRIADLRVELPSLRDRGDDVLKLAELFLRRRAGSEAPRRLGVDACAALRAHTWPGNVRELKSVIDRAFVMADAEVIERSDLDLSAGDTARRGVVDADLLRLPHADAIAAFERRYFEDLMAHHATKVKAARAAGMTPEGLRLALRRLKL
jgi:DNA-binding NtrC family response regulator